jgi:hypothetical protein
MLYQEARSRKDGLRVNASEEMVSPLQLSPNMSQTAPDRRKVSLHANQPFRMTRDWMHCAGIQISYNI